MTTFPVLRRDQIAEQYRRDYLARRPDADVGVGSEVDISSRVLADQLLPVMAYAEVQSGRFDLDNASGPDLDEIGAKEGVPRPAAAGASGSVIISAAVGGTKLWEGDQLFTVDGTDLRFQCAVTGYYNSSTPVPILGIDTGPGTNLPAGAVLQWDTPREGCGPECVVYEQTDGSGLTGGRDAATDEEYREIMREKRARPAASGNDAEYISATESIPGLAVQKAFAWPAVAGPGTIGVSFTMKPSAPGGNRTPNSAQLAIAERHLLFTYRMPADDSVLMIGLLSHLVTLGFRVSWRQSAAGWVDVAPWPTYDAAGNVVVASGVHSEVSCRVTTTVSRPAPTVGQTIAFYRSGDFHRKRISAVSVVAPGLTWDLTFEAGNNASDAAYIPVAGQRVSPWSPSLPVLTTTVLSHLDKLGPGEMFSSFPAPGLRRRRSPESPESWPAVLDNRVISAMQTNLVVLDVSLLEPATPYAPPLGAPGSLAYVLRLGDLAFYP